MGIKLKLGVEIDFFRYVIKIFGVYDLILIFFVLVVKFESI